MQQQFKQGWMVAFDQQLNLPEKWSLSPEDTLGLLWWTKDPTNLIENQDLLRPYRNKIHVTVTGWEEVEKGAPLLWKGAMLLVQTAKSFGPENVSWRMSPVPVTDDVLPRFATLAEHAQDAGLKEVFISFLQQNDWIAETRSASQRIALMNAMAEKGERYGLKVRLCNEDRTLANLGTYKHPGLDSGVCAPPEAFGLPGVEVSPSEGCGCGYAIDPFTVNESCTFGCKYCYAADQNLADRKRNTTRLPVVR
jgi:hypothetical protein